MIKVKIAEFKANCQTLQKMQQEMLKRNGICYNNKIYAIEKQGNNQ